MPGWFAVTTRAGARYTIRAPRILEPLPAARPSDPPRPLPAHEIDVVHADDGDDPDHEPDHGPPPRSPSNDVASPDVVRARRAAALDPPPF